ncbi:hypothetical protein LguiA_008333 [Lonicera macranthoides]
MSAFLALQCSFIWRKEEDIDIQSPVSSVASNISTTPSAAAKPIIETPKRHPQPQVLVANSTAPSAVAKPKTETPKSSHNLSPSRKDSSLASSSSSSGTPQLYIKFKDPTTTTDYTQTPSNDPQPRTISPANYTSFMNQLNTQTPMRIQYPVSSVAPNTSTTPSAAAKPIIETPKRHPQPQVSIANSTAPSVVAKPKTETPKSSHNPPPSRQDSSLASSSSSFGTPQLSIKPILSQAPLDPTIPQTVSNYVLVEKRGTPLYMIPEDIKVLIQKDIVPGVLNKPLSPSNYSEYFAALLYAENYYIEKWDGFEMKNVSLQLHEAAIYGWKSKNKHLNRSDEKDNKIFVAFEIDYVPKRRPFLLSRDFASVRPSGGKVEPFQGIIYRVVKSNRVLVEFGEDFHSQHYSSCKYDVKFSFNRVCLKRAHQAIAAAPDVLLRKFLFPEQLPKIYPIQTHVFVNHELDMEQANAVRYIIRLQDPPPYLVEGPLSVTDTKELPQYASSSKELLRTGVVVREAFDMFRANAAFRDGVPIYILLSCLYEGECFSCPSPKELKKYKVILSTFMSSFRLHDEGIVAGHFSHIFLVDASSATEPETMVPLANLANERTAVVITGAPNSHSRWVRSNIAKQYG